MAIPGSSSSNESSRATYADLLNSSEERIVREMRAGNNDAFAVIFRRFHRLVHVTALRILRDAGEAEDLTQSVFLETYRKLGQFDPARGTLKVWLLQYAYSRSMSRRNYLQAREVHLEARAEDVEERATLWWSMRAPQETTLLTEQILGALSEPQRETIRMFFFHGLTLKEIAERRQETFSNVRHHYYRGLQQLRSVLQDGMDARDDPKQNLVRFGEVRRAET